MSLVGSYKSKLIAWCRSDISKIIAPYWSVISKTVARVSNYCEIIGIGRIEIVLHNTTCPRNSSETRQIARRQFAASYRALVNSHFFTSTFFLFFCSPLSFAAPGGILPPPIIFLSVAKSASFTHLYNFCPSRRPMLSQTVLCS